MRLARAAIIGLAAAGMSAAPLVAHAQTSPVTLPRTTAGTLFSAWLEAFNSGDSLRLGAYHEQYDPDRIPAHALRQQTGGFDLLTLEHAAPSQIEVTVRRRSGPQVASVVLTTASDGSMKVATHRIRTLGEHGSADAMRIDGATRSRVIEGAVAKLDQAYVFPEIAAEAGDSLRARLERGEYDSYTTGLGFATRLHDELREITRDKHMSLDYKVPAPPPDGPPPPALTPQQLQAQAVAQMEANNCGFERAEVLPDNVGYLKFNYFGNVTVCGPTASAAMNFLANTEAIIVDLRDNTGGSPAMVAHVSSYLFSERTHLNSLWTRVTGQTTEFWTTDDVPGRRFGGEKPVYVLTSSRTFSGAEEFSYNLQSLGRGAIVGETTGGGAHPVSSHPIADDFTIRVPFARAINPITQTNWEGVGVEPDVKVPASDALATALRLVAERSRP